MEQVKICRECGLEKPLDEFNKRRGSKDGHQGMCRSCFSRYNKVRYHSDPARFRKDVAEYREKNMENVFETRMEMCRKNPIPKNANEALNLAVKLGYVDKPDHCLGCGCPTGESRVTAHHNDYTKPLEVVWVCQKCHKQLDANRRIREGLPAYRNASAVDMLRDGERLCTFDTIADAARAVGCNPSAIGGCIRGERKTCAGFEWRRAGG